MMALDKILGALSGILDHFLADDVLPEGFLHQNITIVFFIGQDTFNRGAGPCRGPFDRWNMVFFQPTLQHPIARTGKEPGIQFPHNCCLLRHDFRFPVLSLFKRIEGAIWNERLSTLHRALLAPCNVFRDGLTFGLCHCAVHGDHKLAVCWQRIDVLFFKEDSDAELPEDARVVDTL